MLENFAPVILDTVAALVIVLDPQGRIVLFNRACEQATGYSAQEVLGRVFWDFLLDEEEIASVQAVFEDLKSGLFPNQHENFWVTREGERLLIAWSNTAVVGPGGRVTYVIATGIDITERRAAEDGLARHNEQLKEANLQLATAIAQLEQANRRLQANEVELRQSQAELRESDARYRSLFKNNHAVMLLIDPQTGDIVDANPAALAFYGYTQEEITGLKITAINTLTEEQVHAEMARAHSEQRRRFLFRHRLAGGEVRDVEVYSGPILVEGKSLLYSIVHDVTERRRYQEAVKAYTRQLERANRELHDFAFFSSHDLQEPLRKIQAFAGRLREHSQAALDDTGLDFLARMENAAARMQAMISDLLAYSRLSTQDQPFQAIDLAALTAEVLSDLEASLEAAQGRVHIGRSATLEGDPLQMRLLLQNLISNALKFHQPGRPPEVQVYARPARPVSVQALNQAPLYPEETFGAASDLDGMAAGESLPPIPTPGSPAGGGSPAWIELVVQDNGIGFDERYLERIFEPFQRLHGRSDYPGNGIGLAICRKIVDRHGGSLTARSLPGQGATFIATLPGRLDDDLERTP